MEFLREPLVHFVAAGAVLFAAYAWFDRDQASYDSIEPVTVTEGDVQWLVETWRRQWMREPGPAEVRGMIADLVDEELMAREALEMGLEKDDTVVRRRLAQKLKFLIEDTSRLVEPSDSELRAYYAGHADRFRPGTTVSFTQVFFNPTDRLDAEADAEASLVALRNDTALPSTAGDRLLVEGDFTDLDRERVAALFGPDFADAVFALEPGSWSGPIASGYGQHLVLVSSKATPEPPPFEAVKDKVVADWWREKEDAAAHDYMDLLRAKYPVEIDPAVQALLDGAPAPGVAQK